MNLELKLQADCFIWHWNKFPEQRGWFRRIKNELDNHPRKNLLDVRKQLAENKMTGIVPGTWDSVYMVRPLVWIEFKVKGGTLSPEQMLFMKRGMEIGNMFFIIYSLTEFQNCIYELSK